MGFLAAIPASAMLAASAASAVAGAGMAAMSAVSQGHAQAANARYQAEVAANNVTIAKQNASMATQQGEAAATQRELKTRANVGAIKAAQAANGIDVNTGSAVDVRSGAEENGQLSALVIKSDAARQAFGYQTQGSNFEAQSGIDTAMGKQAETAGDLGAVGSVVGGASNLTGQYLKWARIGDTGGGKSSGAVDSGAWDVVYPGWGDG